MTSSDFQESMQIVFDKEESDLNTEGYSFYEGSQAQNITYPNGEVLLQIYAGLGTELLSELNKMVFRQILRTKIIASEEIRYLSESGSVTYTGLSTLCFYTLIRLGFTDDAIDCLRNRQKDRNGIYNILIQILERVNFNQQQLKAISDIANAHKGYSVEVPLKRKLVQVRFNQLENNLKKINIEINQDKATLKEKFFLMQFGDKYNGLLEDMDNYILTENSKAVNAGMISNLRAFIADLLKDIATRIAQTEGIAIPHIDRRGEMGDIRGYLQSRLNLSKEDNEFIDSFVKILHAEGGHSFTSEKEYFRLARNIGIEIALFMMSKYEKKYKIRR